MINRPPYETFKGATCRGSFALGSACGTCEKCQWERDQMHGGPGMTLREVMEAEEPLLPQPRKKALYVGAPACFALEQCCQHINDAFKHDGPGYSGGCYLVGSALERQDWRDIDVRYIMPDEQFASMFPNCGAEGHWESDPRWLLLTVSIAGWLRDVTGLPVDFQIQPQTHANERHKGTRSALGLRIAKP